MVSPGVPRSFPLWDGTMWSNFADVVWSAAEHGLPRVNTRQVGEDRPEEIKLSHADHHQRRGPDKFVCREPVVEAFAADSSIEANSASQRCGQLLIN